MSDIKNRKPKVINLRRHKKPRVLIEPAKLEIKTEPSESYEKPSQTLQNPPEPSQTLSGGKCIKCGAVEASIKELGYCSSCQIDHQKVIERLDANPTKMPEKVPIKWICRTDGRGVTTYMTVEEGRLLGIKVE